MTKGVTLFVFLFFSSSPGLALHPYPGVLRGVSELEHVNKPSINHCIERYTCSLYKGGGA